MKNLIIAITLLLTACGGSNESPTYTATPPPTPPPEPVPVTRSIFVYDGVDVSTSDGESTFYYHSGHVNNARDGFISVDDILFGVDSSGETIITDRLPCTPDAVVIAADTWSFKNIDPATSASLGGLPKWHTEIYQNGNLYSAFYLNQYQVVDAFMTISGDVVSVDTVGKFRAVLEPGLNILNAAPDSLMVHSVDYGTKNATIRDGSGDHRIDWYRNYFLAADEWQYTYGKWYAWNGYTWNGTITEDGSALSMFKTTTDVLVSVGTRFEYGETVLYYIDCCCGLLYRYTPSLDRVELVEQLFIGTGDRLEGVNVAGNINPVMLDDKLMFKVADTVYRYDFNSVSVFMSGVTIWGM